jgi:hypothetical protein
MQSNRQFWEEQGEAWKPMSAKDKNVGKKKKKDEEEEKAKKEPNLEAGEEDAPLLVSFLVGAGRRLHLRAACSFCGTRPRGTSDAVALFRCGRATGVTTTSTDTGSPSASLRSQCF